MDSTGLCWLKVLEKKDELPRNEPIVTFDDGDNVFVTVSLLACLCACVLTCRITKQLWTNCDQFLAVDGLSMSDKSIRFWCSRPRLAPGRLEEQKVLGSTTCSNLRGRGYRDGQFPVCRRLIPFHAEVQKRGKGTDHWERKNTAVPCPYMGGGSVGVTVLKLLSH